MTKNRQKLNCAKFFEKFKNCYFFWFFRRRCLKISSEGTKNNQKKISSCFREICEFVFRKSKKNQPPILAKLFEKKNIPIFFREYSKNNFRNIYFRDLKKLKKITRKSLVFWPTMVMVFFSTFWTQIHKFVENNLIFFSDCFRSTQKRF